MTIALQRAFALLFAVLVAATLIGCGGSSSSSLTNGANGGPEASTSAAGSFADDAGNPALSGDGGAGGPLQVHIQVVGGGGACGACVVVLGQAVGGQRPYTYSWSDPAWHGAGPFTLCPTAATAISLAVTSSPQSEGEGITLPGETARAETPVDCVAEDGGADASGPGPLNGCVVTSAGDAGDAGPITCTANEIDASVAWADGGVAYSQADLLPFTLLAGHTYQVSYDQLLPIELGAPVTVDIYGSTEPNACDVGEKLFTLTINGSITNWNQSYCFTPTRDYNAIVQNIAIQGVFGYVAPILAVSTFCDECSGD